MLKSSRQRRSFPPYKGGDVQASCKAALFAVKKSGTTFKRRLFGERSLFLLVQHYNCSAFPCICVALLCRAAATFRHLRQSKLRQVFLALRVLLASPRVDGGVSRNVAARQLITCAKRRNHHSSRCRRQLIPSIGAAICRNYL